MGDEHAFIRVGNVYSAKDKREPGRHVQVVSMFAEKIKCRTYFPHTNSYSDRATTIRADILLTRWVPCSRSAPCSPCATRRVGQEAT